MGKLGQDEPRLLQMCSNKAPESCKIAQRHRKMVPRWLQHGPRWSKMLVSSCLRLSSWAFSGVPWLCLRPAFALPSLCFRFAFALSSLYFRFAFALPSLCFRFACVLLSLCLRFAFASPSLCLRFAFSLPLLLFAFALPLPSEWGGVPEAIRCWIV
jgi:hypothetical protein